MAVLTNSLWQASELSVTPDEIARLVAQWQWAELDKDQDVRLARNDAAIESHYTTLMETFGGALYEQSHNDTSLAERHLADIVRAHGIVLDVRESTIAKQMLLKAHWQLFRAFSIRNSTKWRPYVDDDPATPLLTALREKVSDTASAGSQPEAPKLAQSSQDEYSKRFSAAAEEAIEALSRTEGLNPNRVKDYRVAVSHFLDWLQDDPPLRAITASQAGGFAKSLIFYPSNAHKRQPYRQLTNFAEKVAKAKEQRESHLLNPATINTKYITPLRRVVEWHRHTGLDLENVFANVRVGKTRKQTLSQSRRDFSNAEVVALLSLPIFVGCSGVNGLRLYQHGSHKVDDWRFWVPLIAFYFGMRLNEICGLAVNDFQIEDGISYMRVQDAEEGQRVKTEAARRQVPTHPRLLELGLWNKMARQRDLGRSRLFDELVSDERGYFSNKPSKFFLRLIGRIEDPSRSSLGKLVFHSIRHTVISKLRGAAVRDDVSKALVGHEQGEVHGSYGSFSLKALRNAIEQIEYPGVDLIPLDRV